MKHLQYPVHVKAPIDHVWAFALDTSRWPDWQPRSEYLDFSGPLDQVGTTYVQRWSMMGHEMTANCNVVEVVPRQLYHEHSDMGPMETVIRLEPEGDGTLVNFEFDYEMPGHLPKILENLVSKGWVERQTTQMLDDFKALAEATAPVAV
jgi:uncharacterized membrane protein